MTPNPTVRSELAKEFTEAVVKTHKKKINNFVDEALLARKANKK